MMSPLMQPTPIALDSNALLPIFRDHDQEVYQGVVNGQLEVYVPVIVYAEQTIYPREPIDNVVDALKAQVVALEIDHTRRLGRLWPTVPTPHQGLNKQELWRRHRFDWLIVAMALYEGWTVVTEDKGPAFCIPGLQVLTVEEFVSRYVGKEP